MDLLGGYNSDDSNSDSDNTNPPLSSQPKPNATQPTLKVNPNSVKKTSEGSKSTSSSSRKGKRLLKLQAVLPENIWNQLSNGNLQKDSDDEESDEEGGKRTVTSRKRIKPSGNNNASQNPGDKSDLTNLLQALPKSKAAAGIGGGSGKSFLQDPGDISNTTTTIGSANASSSTTDNAKPSPAPLGAAFLSTTVETIRKKKSGPSTARDIHGQSSSVAVETVHDDKDDTAEDNENAPRNAASAAPRKPSSSLHAAVRSSSSVPRPGMSSVSSSSRRARMAAPTVSAARYQQQQPQPSYPVPSGMAQYAPTAAYPVATPSPALPSQGRPGASKSRKREMERMLRQGNLAGVTSDVHLEGQAHVYQQPQEAQQQSYQSHGVRVVPTAQYNTGAGGMVTAANITGKQRGKNQMNALLSSAASLEAQRARNPLPQQKVQRANAKRKYGW
ncbi:unnamed protein product [Cylindrotheca closterium]|uniref:Uncharacterized protein n=1 Tax=Cylindrotheca closterium TaxID=2856 RepID=A0AAD2FXY7_9STRA|nr:unnamed protein product [Cylindrotheca closterium]